MLCSLDQRCSQVELTTEPNGVTLLAFPDNLHSPDRLIGAAIVPADRFRPHLGGAEDRYDLS
jgi:hypothetical protein